MKKTRMVLVLVFVICVAIVATTVGLSKTNQNIGVTAKVLAGDASEAKGFSLTSSIAPKAKGASKVFWSVNHSLDSVKDQKTEYKTFNSNMYETEIKRNYLDIEFINFVTSLNNDYDEIIDKNQDIIKKEEGKLLEDVAKNTKPSKAHSEIVDLSKYYDYVDYNDKESFTVESGTYGFLFKTPLNEFIKVPMPKGYKCRYDVTKDDKDRIVEYGIWDYDKDGKTLNKDELVIKGFGAFDSENLYFTIDSKTMNPSDRAIYKVKPKADIDMYSQKITDFEAIDFKDVKKAVGISSDEKIGEIITDSDKDLIVVTYKGNKYIVKTYEKDTFKLKETSEFTMNGKYAMEMGIRQIGEKALALSTYNGLAILEKSNRGYTKKIEADAGKYFINFDKMTMIYNEGKLIIGETQNRENVRAGIYNKDKTLFVCEYAYDLGDDFGLVLDPYANETSYLGSTNNTGVDKKVVWPIKISSEEAK